MILVTPPFELGDTLKGTDADGNLINTDKEGLQYVFPDIRRTGNQRGQKALRSNIAVKAVVLRNTAGFALLGKRLGRRERDTSNPFEFGTRVNGYSATLRGTGVVAIDEHLPTAGVAANDLFWGIISGPWTGLTANAGADFPEDIAAHGRLIAGTVDGTTTSLGGRLASVTLSTATQALETQLIGWALTARTTQATGSEVYVMLTNGFES